MLYKQGSGNAKNIVYSQSPFIFNTAILLGGTTGTPGEEADFYDLINADLTLSSNDNLLTGIQYGYWNNIQYGDGSAETIFVDTNKSLIFPKSSDGVNYPFDVYLSTNSIVHNLKASDKVEFTNSLIGATEIWLFKTDSSSSASATIDYTGTILIKASIELQSHNSMDSMTWVAGVDIIHNNAEISNCVIDGFTRADGCLSLTTTHNITNTLFKNMVNAIEIDTAGDYDLSTNSFINNTNDIEVTATTGTINITIDFTPNPSYTTAGATVNFIAPSTSFGFTVSPSIIDYEWRLYEVDDTGSLDGAVEIDGEENATADNQTIVNDQIRTVALQIISQPDHDYVESITWFNLAASDLNVTIFLKEDINN